MKRRHVLGSILIIPAITALPAAAQTPAPEKPPAKPDESLKVAVTAPDAATEPIHAFFTAEQYRALEHLSDLLFPAADPKPGAKEAGVAAFLDFLISRSPQERQTLYRRGLDRLNADARARFHVAFADVSSTQAAELLAPLRTPWTYQGPSDQFARFLTSAKEDVLRATVNSREWAAAATGRRGGSGIGSYWYSLDVNAMKHDYDVLIIGSGASGGMAAHTLTKLGVRCLMLDAGPPLDFERQRTLKPVYDLPYRGFGQPGRFPHVTQASEFDANLWADEKQNPYTYDPKDPYYWVRIRLIGGKTLRWGRASWRMSDYEFKCKDHDGFGDNWPISL